MLPLFKKNSPLLNIITSILLASIGLVAFTGCEAPGLADSTTNVNR